MDPASTLPFLLACAWLIPLASFVAIVLFGKYMGPGGKFGGYLATLAIVTSAVLSFTAMFGVWLPNYPVEVSHHTAAPHEGEAAHADGGSAESAEPAHDLDADTHHAVDPTVNNDAPDYVTGNWYTLAEFGKLKLTIGYYIDALTVGMFCMVTLIASCVHFYALGYMHDELHEPFVDHEVTLSNGEHLHRKGRFYRFFQYLSLFCFSMLGIVIAGNLAMVFVFWELVGICSYFLIGFYIERKSASTAANKAFIVNRVGDFGMLIGMMALWSSIGTFNFGDIQTKTEQGVVTEQGLFSQLHTEENEYRLAPTESMIAEETRMKSETGEVASAGGEAAVEDDEESNKAGQWLLFIAGVGIFCGCVGKSAQFPLHVWLPDAMEGPTPVSALVHSATMVAAGVYLVGRFYPVFSPEALLVIAYTGSITAIIAATIAITATDIKRVLAYSTVSQLGYMMLALGLGGWVAGIFHLITHAFFKGLLFMCSGSVIHAVHTNDMSYMGGLRKKMPITAYTMLIGCLAIIGAGIPFTVFGFSGYFSKDAIIEQAWSYSNHSPQHSLFLKWLPVIGAAVTAFYMFRLWYLTFAGTPRDKHRFDHAHESPRVMTTPLIVLSIFAIAIGWPIFGVYDMLDNARPIGTLATTEGELWQNVVVPSEHLAHEPNIKQPAAIAAITAAGLGLLLASVIYLWRLLNPDELKQSFKPLHGFLWNKWYFDEIYDFIFVKPVLWFSGFLAWFDRGIIDSILHGSAAICRGLSKVVDALFDQTLVDGTVNTFASGTWGFGLWLRKLQTGNLRQYVMFIVVGTVLLFVAITFVQNYLSPTQNL